MAVACGKRLQESLGMPEKGFSAGQQRFERIQSEEATVVILTLESMRTATKSRMTRCRRNPCFFVGSRRLPPSTVDAVGEENPAIVSQPVKLASMEAGCAGVMPAGDR